jgi:hypothetical protein
MGKYYGNVGYRETVETEPGVWVDEIIDYPYYVDVIKNYVHSAFSEHVTTIKTPECSNSISIVANPYAYEHFHNIVYAEYMGAKWVVTNVDATQYPRLILSLGGIYNGEDPTDSSSDSD